MKPSVYALAESALFRVSPYHYALLAVVVIHLTRILLQRMRFVKSVSWIPGPPALPLIGNALSLTIEQHEFYRLLLQCGEKYGRIFRLWIGTRIFVFMANAEDIQPILNSIHHIDKSFEYTFLRDWLGHGLITATGAKWQRSRKLLTPSFHYNMLSEFAEPIGKQVNILLDVLSQRAQDDTPFDVTPLLKLCTLDIICVTAMGKQVDAQMNADQDYVKAVESISTVVQRRFITPWLKPNFLFRLSSLGRIQAKSIAIVNQFVRQVIEAKKEEKKMKDAQEGTPNGCVGKRSKKAFLDMLLEANDSGADFTDQDMEDEVHTFMFAGHDTTATNVGWCLYVLGKHPETQSQIVEEFARETEAEGEGYQQMKNLPYLDMCIREVLRLYPVAPLIARDIRTPVELSDGRVLPAGVTALIHSPMLHRDPTYFPDPDSFRPERFQLGSADTKHPFAYIPFSAGPRNCIGQRFAQMTTKLIVGKILQRFHVTSVDPEEKLNLVSDIVLNNREGINITLRPRHS